MIRPHLQDDRFLDDVRTAPAEDGIFHVWWLGQSGYLIRWGTRKILLDPYLSDSLTRKYAETDKPHIRMTELVINPARLDGIQVVTSSHHHTDHLDPETLTPLVAVNPGIEIVTPEAHLALTSERTGVEEASLTGLNAGESSRLGEFELRAIAAAHDELTTDDEGNHLFLGYVVRFGDWTIYHSGDTRLYDGLAESLQEFDIDVAMLPINGAAPERRVAGNLWGHEAAALAKEIGAKIVFPCHYDLFSFNTATPDAFVHECWRQDQAYRVLRSGERWSSCELRVV